jgi:putative glutamine amidotransferase
MQLFCLARGGSLYPHIPDFFEDCLDHRMNSKDLRIAGHCIKIKEHSRLFQWLAKEKCQVNSSHHQAVHTPGKGVILSAVAEDGVIEAVEAEDGSFTGVQWHPESLFLKSREQRSLFANFVASL